MKKLTTENKKLLKELTTELKSLQQKLAEAQKLEGKDTNIAVVVRKNQGRSQKIVKKDAASTVVGKYFIELQVTAKQAAVYMPLSVASGKKTAGFMYQIEGTAPGSIVTTAIKVRGEGVTQITVGRLLFAKIPAGKTAAFEIQATIRGASGKRYTLVFTRLNYKLSLTEVRYEQYLKEMRSDSVLFS